MFYNITALIAIPRLARGESSQQLKLASDVAEGRLSLSQFGRQIRHDLLAVKAAVLNEDFVGVTA